MRVTRSIWTFLTSQVAFIVSLAMALIATPLLLHWLGDERYGAFEAAIEWIGYIALLEFGISGALLPLFAKALGRGDEQQVRTILAAAIRSYLIVIGLMALGAAILVTAIVRVLPVAADLRSDLRLGCAIGVLTLVLTPLSPFRTLLEAGQKEYLVNLALLVQNLLLTALSLILAWAQWGISGQFVAVLAGGLGFSAITVGCSRAHLAALRGYMNQKVRESKEWKAIWDLNWPSFGFNLCGRIGLLTDNMIVAALLSPAMVVPFFLTQQLAVLVRRQLQGIGNASWAALVELRVRGETELFNQRLIELTRLVSILAVAALVPVVIYDRCFIRVWVGSQRFGGDFLVIVAGLNAFLLAIFSLWTWCINGVGEVRMILPGIMVQTAINLVVSLLFTLWIGLVGPVLGTTIGFLTVSIWYLPRLLSRLFATRVSDLFGAVGWPLASAAPFAAVVWSMSRTLPVSGWLDMAAEMSVAALGYLVVWWLVGLSAGERHLWLQRMNLLTPRGSY